jgi:hypothetical protein
MRPLLFEFIGVIDGVLQKKHSSCESSERWEIPIELRVAIHPTNVDYGVGRHGRQLSNLEMGNSQGLREMGVMGWTIAMLSCRKLTLL